MSRVKHQEGWVKEIEGVWWMRGQGGGGVSLLWDPGTTSRDRAEEVFQEVWSVIMDCKECVRTMCVLKNMDDRLTIGREKILT